MAGVITASELGQETPVRRLAHLCDHPRMAHSLESLVIRHTLRLSCPKGSAGEGTTAARQFDAALTTVGFKLSAELLERLSGLSEAAVVHTARRTLRTVREMVGDHIRHNSYFIGFRPTCRTPKSSGCAV